MDFEFGGGLAARGGAEHVGIGIPVAATEYGGVAGYGRVPGVWFVFGVFGVSVREVVVEGEFGGVSVHVVKTPGVGFFGAYFLILEFGVVDEPGVFAELCGVVAEGVCGIGSGAAGVFPFGFCGEAVEVAGLSGEPLAEFVGGVVGDADGGIVFGVAIAHGEVHGDVGRGGLADGVDEGFAVFDFGGFGGGHVGITVEGAVFVAAFAVFHVGAVEIPCGFHFGHPEGRDGYFGLRTFVWFAVCGVFRGADFEGSGRDWYHLDGGAGSESDGLGVGFHGLSSEFFFCHDFFVDGLGGGEEVGVGKFRRVCGEGGEEEE